MDQQNKSLDEMEKKKAMAVDSQPGSNQETTSTNSKGETSKDEKSEEKQSKQSVAKGVLNSVIKNTVWYSGIAIGITALGSLAFPPSLAFTVPVGLIAAGVFFSVKMYRDFPQPAKDYLKNAYDGVVNKIANVLGRKRGKSKEKENEVGVGVVKDNTNEMDKSQEKSKDVNNDKGLEPEKSKNNEKNVEVEKANVEERSVQTDKKETLDKQTQTDKEVKVENEVNHEISNEDAWDYKPSSLVDRDWEYIPDDDSSSVGEELEYIPEVEPENEPEPDKDQKVVVDNDEVDKAEEEKQKKEEKEKKEKEDKEKASDTEKDKSDFDKNRERWENGDVNKDLESDKNAKEAREKRMQEVKEATKDVSVKDIVNKIEKGKGTSAEVEKVKKERMDEVKKDTAGVNVSEVSKKFGGKAKEDVQKSSMGSNNRDERDQLKDKADTSHFLGRLDEKDREKIVNWVNKSATIFTSEDKREFSEKSFDDAFNSLSRNKRSMIKGRFDTEMGKDHGEKKLVTRDSVLKAKTYKKSIGKDL